ncbi:MAG TPA: hypothetical protein VIW80_16625 [Pyrinomonadaceae bacterium]
MQKQNKRAVYDAARGRAIQKACVMLYDVRDGGPTQTGRPAGDFVEDQEITDDPPFTPAQ